MIRVLIMDDTPEKTGKIKSVLTGKCMLHESEITVAKSINSGRRMLSADSYDLLILDLVMPVNDGEEVGAEGQSEGFIDELSRVGRLNKPIYIIALTQYKEKIEENRQTYAKKLWKLIHYDLKQTEWEDVLQDAVDTIIETKRKLLEHIAKENRFDVGLLCALPEEFEMMKAATSPNWVVKEDDHSPFNLYTLQVRTENGHSLRLLACCCNAPGMQAASVAASYMLSRYGLAMLFMTGFCAGFKKDGVNRGDLFVADSEYDYGSGKLARNANNDQVLNTEQKQYPCSFELLGKLNAFIAAQNMPDKLRTELERVGYLQEEMGQPAIHVAPGTCGSYVVGDEAFMNKLRKEGNRKLTGLDMEGYGLYLAGHMLKKDCVLVKGIADYGDGVKDDKYHRTCSYASAWFVMRFIKVML